MFEGIERVVFTRDWITVILMLVLLALTALKFVYNERFTKLFSLLYSEKYFTNYSKTKPLIFNKFHLFFFIVILFNISLLLFFGFKAFKPTPVSYDFNFFIQIVLIAILYVFLRYLVGYLLAIMFGISEFHKHLTLLKITNLSLVFVLSFPLLILINYSSSSFHKFLITFSVIGILVMLLIRYYIIVKKIRENFSIFFYLILYICALEIAPIIVIYKMFVD